MFRTLYCHEEDEFFVGRYRFFLQKINFRGKIEGNGQYSVDYTKVPRRIFLTDPSKTKYRGVGIFLAYTMEGKTCKAERKHRRGIERSVKRFMETRQKKTCDNCVFEHIHYLTNKCNNKFEEML
jgi:hypothetical protein